MVPSVNTSSTCAFVVGTNAYNELLPLKNAVRDAQVVEKELRQVGVERITSAFDCTYDQLTQKTNEYLSQLRKGDVAVVFAAAHAAMYQSKHVFLTTNSNEKNIAHTSLRVELLLNRSVPFCVLCACAMPIFSMCLSLIHI